MLILMDSLTLIDRLSCRSLAIDDGSTRSRRRVADLSAVHAAPTTGRALAFRQASLRVAQASTATADDTTMTIVTAERTDTGCSAAAFPALVPTWVTGVLPGSARAALQGNQ